MYPNKMRPCLTRQKYKDIRPCENGESETLIGLKDSFRHAVISHDLGISWKQIDNVSGSPLEILYHGTELIIVSDKDTGRLYLLDGRGNLTREFIFKPGVFMASVHPIDSNAILLQNYEYNDEFRDFAEGTQTVYYTKDGGASGWKVLTQNYSTGTKDYSEVPFYQFVTGGMRDLIYEYDDEYDGYSAYALNIFSDAPVEFTRFPFLVHKTQDIFYGIKNEKELHVSKDGVNFEHVEFPSHLSPLEHKNSVSGFIGTRDYMSGFGHNVIKSKGYLFLQKYDKIEEDSYERVLPWCTLFRYDVMRKNIKFLLDYCYDYLIVSAEEGIMIANYITNPQGCADHKEKVKCRTVITFNDGLDWKPMTGPSGAELRVGTNSTLWSSHGDIPSCSSTMIVCGREVPIENHQDSHTNRKIYPPSFIYKTNDSGRSWRQINDKDTDWMIGGRDDIIVMKEVFDYEYILYSLDGGIKWHKLPCGFHFTRLDPKSSSNNKRFWLGECSISFDPADQVEQSYL